MLLTLYQKHTKHIRISRAYSWTTLHCQNDRLDAPDRTWDPAAVTHMLYANQDCHGVGSCVKTWELFFVKPEWKSMDSINGISYYLDKFRRYHTHHRRQFFFHEHSSLVHCACSTVQLLQSSRLIHPAFEWKMWFSCYPVLPRSAEAQVIWGGIWNIFWFPTLSVTFLPKDIKICSCVSKL